MVLNNMMKWCCSLKISDMIEEKWSITQLLEKCGTSETILFRSGYNKNIVRPFLFHSGSVGSGFSATVATDPPGYTNSIES